MITSLTFQFWVAQERCDDTTRISNAITQLDLIKRMVQNYSNYLQWVRTSDGKN